MTIRSPLIQQPLGSVAEVALEEEEEVAGRPSKCSVQE